MKPTRLIFVLCFFIIAMATSAHADLNIFLGDLNQQAQGSPLDYNTKLSNQFGVPQPQIATLLGSVAAPADAYMCLQVAQMLGIPHTQVLRSYNTHRNKGWGAIAQELGIMPGSPEFHALKNGDFAFTGTPGGKHHGDHKKGKDGDHDDDGKGNGQGKGDHDDDGKGKGQGKGSKK